MPLADSEESQDAEQYPETERMYGLMGMAYREIGDEEEAMEIWKKSLIMWSSKL